MRIIKNAFIILTMSLLLILIGCENPLSVTDSNHIEKTSEQVRTTARVGSFDIESEMEKILKEMAKSVAIIVTDRNVSTMLKTEIGKKFDGDFNVLWKDIKGQRSSDTETIREKLSQQLRLNINANITIDDIETIPNLQIALPLHYDEWDGKSSLLVAYTPLAMNEQDVEIIIAYNSKGKEYELDARNEPKIPVLVVGINERVDKNGNINHSRFVPPGGEGIQRFI